MTYNMPNATADIFAGNSFSCPIARIEAERKLSPMAKMVRHTREAPAFI
ncbi:MAG TPA: hypothetical protein VIN59_06970 [Alphaproteobacteria bacterium]